MSVTPECAEHRPYLAAIADGELGLVPEATLSHVRECPDCSREVGAHGLLGRRLRDGAREPAPVPAVPTRRLGLAIPLAAAAALALVLTGALLATRSGPDPLANAMLVAGRAPMYRSSDPTDIARWCTAHYGNRVPEVRLAGLQPEGARMDWPEKQPVATITYLYDGHQVHVSWLNAGVGGQVPAQVTVDGQTAVVVRAHGVSALVSGAAPAGELMRIAQEIAAGE